MESTGLVFRKDPIQDMAVTEFVTSVVVIVPQEQKIKEADILLVD